MKNSSGAFSNDEVLKHVHCTHNTKCYFCIYDRKKILQSTCMNGVLAYNGYENKCQSEWLF